MAPNRRGSRGPDPMAPEPEPIPHDPGKVEFFPDAPTPGSPPLSVKIVGGILVGVPTLIVWVRVCAWLWP